MKSFHNFNHGMFHLQDLINTDRKAHVMFLHMFVCSQGGGVSQHAPGWRGVYPSRHLNRGVAVCRGSVVWPYFIVFWCDLLVWPSYMVFWCGLLVWPSAMAFWLRVTFLYHPLVSLFMPMFQIFNHEDYSEDFTPHDVAVIRIWPPVKFR